MTFHDLFNPNKAVPNLSDLCPWLIAAYGEKNTGVVETGANKRILSYLRTAKYYESPEVLTTDATPWCSAFVNWCMGQVGVRGTLSLAANSWLHWGMPLHKPVLGCVSVFHTDGHEHVGFFVKQQGNKIRLLGGNQQNRVKLSDFSVGSLLSYRWPKDPTRLEHMFAWQHHNLFL